MSDYIPPEIIKDILSQLPMKSLLRFRCVSKSWRSLIDSNDFIKLHLHHSSKTSSDRTLLVDSTQFYYIDLDSFERLDIGNARFEPCSMVNSCNGLVLVASNSKDIVLWNPSTRKIYKLPTTPIECSFDSCKVYFALGYDSKHDDYKFGIYLDDVSHSFVEYDRNSKMFLVLKWGVYLNDALHIIVKCGRNSEAIMAFDLGKEEHYEVPKPKFSGASRSLSLVKVMEGYLAAVVSGKKNRSEIWLMKEYGVKESWFKLLCFVPPISEPCRNLCPLAYSKSGDEVLLNYEGKCLNWYTLRKKTVTVARVNGLSASFGAGSSPLDPSLHAEVCFGSLVSPYSPAGIATEKQEDGHGKKGKDMKKKRDDFLSAGFKLVL